MGFLVCSCVFFLGFLMGFPQFSNIIACFWWNCSFWLCYDGPPYFLTVFLSKLLPAVGALENQ